MNWEVRVRAGTGRSWVVPGGGPAPAAAQAVGDASRRVGGGRLDHGPDGVAAAAADRAGPAGLRHLLGGARAGVDRFLDGMGRDAEAEADVHLSSGVPRWPAPGGRRTAAGRDLPRPPT